MHVHARGGPLASTPTRSLTFIALAVCAVLSGCTAPYRGAKVVGGLGGIFAAAGGATWVVGEKTDSSSLIVPGVLATIAGAVGMAAAAMMVAAQSSCTADAECPEGYSCRELPAPAGQEPYSQCVPR